MVIIADDFAVGDGLICGGQGQQAGEGEQQLHGWLTSEVTDHHEACVANESRTERAKEINSQWTGQRVMITE